MVIYELGILDLDVISVGIYMLANWIEDLVSSGLHFEWLHFEVEISNWILWLQGYINFSMSDGKVHYVVERIYIMWL